MIPDSSVNEVIGWQAEIFLPVHERIFLFDAKKGLVFLKVQQALYKPIQALRVPEG